MPGFRTVQPEPVDTVSIIQTQSVYTDHTARNHTTGQKDSLLPGLHFHIFHSAVWLPAACKGEDTPVGFKSHTSADTSSFRTCSGLPEAFFSCTGTCTSSFFLSSLKIYLCWIL